MALVAAGDKTVCNPLEDDARVTRCEHGAECSMASRRGPKPTIARAAMRNDAGTYLQAQVVLPPQAGGIGGRP